MTEPGEGRSAVGGAARPARHPLPAGLRARFAIAFAGVAAMVAVLVGVLGYDSAATLIRHDRANDFSQSLDTLVGAVQTSDRSTADFLPTTAGRDGLEDQLTRSGDIGIQVVDGGGTVVKKGVPDPLRVEPADAKLAANGAAGKTRRVEQNIDGDRYLVVTVSLGDGRGAVQLSQLLSSTDDLLDLLLERVALVATAVVIAAGAAGWWLAGRITRRLVQLTGAAEQVASTGQLDVDVPRRGSDEIGRLGRAFDDMLGRLARSKDDQRRLVQDAGHELRTPLTSLRTNIAALPHLDRLPQDSREALLDDLATETRELSVLVNELVELAADRREVEEPTEIELDLLAERVADLARRRTGREIVVDSVPTPGTGRPNALQRAMTNLVENAAKFAADGSEIRLRVRPGQVAVLDRGPGIDEADLSRIFDRFYRATKARSLPGSGLGLSIVREVAESHGGSVYARNRSKAEGGGAEIGFTLAMRQDAAK
ncbi:sensor histidine kinase [Streptacidiphilus carbonis]|uniref:sensor histidine kinase n=1 Tax=Streptacidiphilus carbonis TaxID=105422 RepID=UPI000A61C3A8|nr:HAMP domain-containing sensor histidine kinase [Streptacidiphilus carbonis]